MRPLLLLIFLSIIYSHGALSQVRVRRGISIPKFKITKHHTTTPAPKKQMKAEIRYGREPTYRSASFNEDFHKTWSKSKKLDYSDFKCSNAPCKPVVAEDEADLLHTIYPNYQAFYQLLEKRRKDDSAKGIILLPSDAQLGLSQKLDSLYTGHNYSVSVDQNTQFTTEIDSPAASALTISPVIYNLNETTFYYNIAALFSKYESWMTLKSADILQHEQIHFDIFELHARILRKQWVSLLRKNEKEGSVYNAISQLGHVYERLYADLEKMQLAFDEETGELTARNESLLRLNESWDRFIKKELDALKEYERPDGIIVFKETLKN